MQDQGRRLLLAVAVALGVMMVWNIFFSKEEPKPPAPGTGSALVAPIKPPTMDIGPSTPGVTPTVPTTPTPGTAGTPTTPTPTPAVEVVRGPEQFIELPSAKLTAKFSSYGGNLISWKLTDKRFGKDATKGELLPPPETFREHGAFELNFSANSTYHVPKQTEWKGEKLSETQVRYTLTTPDVTLVKTYTLDPNSYLIRSSSPRASSRIRRAPAPANRARARRARGTARRCARAMTASCRPAFSI
jgi:YidC/Oxa1 family membrane protein insertase